jgi:CheY-like chemotaxis protein
VDKQVLLIMPKMKLRSTFSEFLQEMGYRVFMKDGPKLAGAACLELQPDLILCYEKLAGMNGADMAATFKQQAELRAIPFLMLTQAKLNDNTPVPDLDALCIDDLIFLPINQTELYSYITNWTEADNPQSLVMEKFQAPQKTDALKAKAPDKNDAWKKGTVNPFSVGKLFYHLIRSKETGTLMIKSERRKMKVTVDQGDVVDVQSNYMRDDTLGRYLMGISKITEEQNKLSLAYASQNGIQQGAAILKLDFMKTDHLAQCITEHKIIKLLNLFQRRWYKSKFRFNPGCDEPMRTDFVRTPLQSIIGNGILNIARKKDLHEIFFRKNRQKATLQICKNFDQHARQFDLGPAQIGQAMQLAGNSLEQIKSQRSDQFEGNLRLAFLLIVTRGMRFITGS